MKTIKQIIKEEIYKLNQEGVADKAAERMFNIPDPNNEKEKIAMSGLKGNDDMGRLIGKTSYGTNLYQNPKSLDNFDENVRAISDINGNLYVLQTNSSDYHKDIASLLMTKNLFDEDYAEEVYRGNYITFHRIRNTDKFGVSISYKGYIEADEEDDEDSELENYIKPEKLFDAVKRKNPNFEFIPKYWLGWI